MQKYLFDVQHQLGLARICKISFGTQKFQTPSLLLPITTPLIHPLKSFLAKWLESYPKSIKNKFSMIFSQISDSDQILTPFPGENTESSKKTSKTMSEGLGMSDIIIPFRQSLDQWGIPFDKVHPLQESLEFSSEIPIFSDNFPNAHSFRLGEYNIKALQHRFELYNQLLSQISLHDPYFRFVLEVRIIEDPSNLEMIVDFVRSHLNSIVGIKFTNIFANMMNFQKILHYIFTLKAQLPSDLIWILGGKFNPTLLPLMVYLGFDIFDMTHILRISVDGLYIDNFRNIWLRELKYPTCNCQACRKLILHLPGKFNITSEQKQLVLEHNLNFLQREILTLKQYVHTGTLRNYLEKNIHNSSFAASSLRWIDTHYKSEIAKRYPIVANYPVVSIGPESYTRPEIVNYMNRLIKEVTPAKTYDLLVILPCAAHKPYSQSRSHLKFIRSLNKMLRPQKIAYHEIIVTSPIGVVPREVETIFPVAHYDIPVTGSWDETEIAITGQLLAQWLKKYDNLSHGLKIVAHVSGGYQEAVILAESILQEELGSSPFRYSMDKDTTYSPSSSQGLNALEKELEIYLDSRKEKSSENPDSPDLHSRSSSKRSEISRITNDEIIIRSIFDYQFGSGVGDSIVQAGAILAPARNLLYSEVFTYDGMGKLLIGRIMKDTGLVKLSSQGAQFIAHVAKKKIVIKDVDIQGTTIFAPIIHEVAPNIHPKDEIIVFNSNNSFLGHGEIVLASKDISQLRFGRISKLRKKKKLIQEEHNLDDILEADL